MIGAGGQRQAIGLRHRRKVAGQRLLLLGVGGPQIQPAQGLKDTGIGVHKAQCAVAGRVCQPSGQLFKPAAMEIHGVDLGDHQIIKKKTAWSAPHPVLEKLTEMFPDIELEHEWADEDIGQNCGRYSYKAGERIEEFLGR